MEASDQEKPGAEGSDRKDGTENNRSDVVENLEQENGVKKVAEGENKFGVGDYVWGKQNYNWWPGKICDPSVTPIFAKKGNVVGYLPVSFYRNKPRFSWCRTSHVKPFAENFTEMSRLSDYESFRVAVGEALQEFTRDFERQLSCACVSSENKSDQDINRGIEQGVNSVAKGNHLKLFIDGLDIGHLLNNLRYAAKGSLDSWLQIRVLRSWLGAFYRKNIGCALIEFPVETVNEGMKHKIGNVVNIESEFGEDGELREEGNSLVKKSSGRKSGRKRNRETTNTTPLESVQGSDLEEDETDGKEETLERVAKRGRKKTKNLSPPPEGTTGERISSVAGIDVNEVLSVIKNVAIDPMDSSRKKNLNQIAEFVSAYRNSVCMDGQKKTVGRELELRRSPRKLKAGMVK